ncbi:MAG: hypothetical protein JWM55_1628 [Acidimicrobiaceae bacterium]|nr:hypothetical protein [Acidimicrobiaceae bacterium]
MVVPAQPGGQVIRVVECLDERGEQQFDSFTLATLYIECLQRPALEEDKVLSDAVVGTCPASNVVRDALFDDSLVLPYWRRPGRMKHRMDHLVDTGECSLIGTKAGIPEESWGLCWLVNGQSAVEIDHELRRIHVSTHEFQPTLEHFKRRA